MKYLKTFENLGFNVEDDKEVNQNDTLLGKKVYLVMSEDEKYFIAQGAEKSYWTSEELREYQRNLGIGVKRAPSYWQKTGTDDESIMWIKPYKSIDLNLDFFNRKEIC